MTDKDIKLISEARKSKGFFEISRLESMADSVEAKNILHALAVRYYRIEELYFELRT